MYPVLMRDCGFPECHGNPERFLRLYGPGRLRLDPETPLFSEVTGDELRNSYDRARSMLATNGDLTTAPLLRKPLATAVSNEGHKGTDNWGRDVYQSASDPNFQILLSWARTAVTSAGAPDAGGSP